MRSEALAHAITHTHLGSVTLRERSQCRGPLRVTPPIRKVRRGRPAEPGDRVARTRMWGRGALDVMWVRRWIGAEVRWTEAA